MMVFLGPKVVTHCDLEWPGAKALLQQVRPQHALGLLVWLRHFLHQHNTIKKANYSLTTAKTGSNTYVKKKKNQCLV